MSNLEELKQIVCRYIDDIANNRIKLGVGITLIVLNLSNYFKDKALEEGYIRTYSNQ